MVWNSDKNYCDFPKNFIGNCGLSPENWLNSDQGSFYFATEIESMNWIDAAAFCKSIDSFLVEVLDIETQIIIL